MTATGLAAKLKLELAELAGRHRVPDPVPVTIPVSPPPLGDIILEGLATSREVPLDRIAVRPWSILILPWWKHGNTPIKLFYKHEQPAGTIEGLEYDDLGRIRIRARVSHPFAKACNAFSISVKVLKYEMRDTDKPSFHAMVLQGELDEISLVERPADPHALVLQRSTPPTLGESFTNTIASVHRLKAMVAALPPSLFTVATASPKGDPGSPLAPKRELSSRREMTPADRARLAKIHERAARAYHAQNLSVPTSASSFAGLVAELNQRALEA